MNVYNSFKIICCFRDGLVTRVMAIMLVVKGFKSILCHSRYYSIPWGGAILLESLSEGWAPHTDGTQCTPTHSYWFCNQRCHCGSLHFFSPLASIVRVPLLLPIQKGQMQFALPWVEGKHRLAEVLRTYGSKILKYYVKTCADFCSVIRGHRTKHNFSSAIFSCFFTGIFLLKKSEQVFMLSKAQG
jgi:hypothetical protein